MARRALAVGLAALWMATGQAAETPPLGTLFHTPDERARLDRLRRGEPEAAAHAPAPGRDAAVTGFVKRSDGRHTVWIDGAPHTVRGPQPAPALDAQSVRAYSDRQDETLKIERKAPR